MCSSDLHGAAVVPGWLVPAALAVLVAAAALLALPRLALPRLASAADGGGRLRLAVPVLACACLLVLPAGASASVVARGLGPFDTPFESRQLSAFTQSFAPHFAQLTQAVEGIESLPGAARFLFGTDTSAMAAPYILASGREVLPIGGYLGGVPAPTLATLCSDIRAGYVHMFVLPIRPASPDPRVRWIEAHCTPGPATNPGRPIQYGRYYC